MRTLSWQHDAILRFSLPRVTARIVTRPRSITLDLIGSSSLLQNLISLREHLCATSDCQASHVT